MHFRYFFIAILFTAYIANSIAQGNNQQIQKFNTKQLSRFSENKGQITDQNGNLRSDVKYIYNAPGFKAIFKDNSFSYEVYIVEKKPKQISESTGKSVNDLLSEKVKQAEDVTVKTHRVDINLSGAHQHPEIVVEGKSRDYNNYYLEHMPKKGVQKVYSYTMLTYKNIWPKIDLVFYARKEGELKYDIIIHPGGKLSDVQFAYNGAGNLMLSEHKLNISTPLGLIKEFIPFSYTAQDKKQVDVNYSLKGNILSLKGKYDIENTLVIDPVLSWGTYYGGTDSDYGNDIITDKTGNVYLTGSAQSFNAIATSGAHQSKHGSTSNPDAYLAKFNSAGEIIWATYYGDGEWDEASSIACNKFGDIYITGYTKRPYANSSGVIATTGAHQTVYGGSWGTEDAFLAKFDSTGTRQWGTLYGGSGIDKSLDVACDTLGNVYITGFTMSSTAIATTGAHKTYLSASDAFLVKFNSFGTRQWGTYYSGSGSTIGSGIKCDLAGNIYFMGSTRSSYDIATTGAHQTAHGGGIEDAFVAKFSSSGKRIWGTYYGGSSNDFGEDITLIGKSIYILGTTFSINDIATSGAHQTSPTITYTSHEDAFLIKFDTSGKRVWGTYFGGYGADYGLGICNDALENIYFTGYTTSTNNLVPEIAMKQYNNYSQFFSYEIYAAKFDSSGARKWATYYGGRGNDHAYAIANDFKGDVYIAGTTGGYDSIATPNAHQTTIGGRSDAFIVKVLKSDITVDSLLGLPLGICYNDSFQLAQVIHNLNSEKDSNKYVVTVIFTGPDTLMFSDSVSSVLGPRSRDTLIFKPWIHFSKPGKYALKIFIKSVDNNSFNDTIRKELIVYRYAVPRFTMLSNCSDSIINFKNMSSSCAGAMSYFWSFGDGDTSTLKEPTKYYNANGDYNVKLVVSTADGKDSLSRKLYYYPKRIVNFNTTFECGTYKVKFTNRSFDSTAKISRYVWKFGDGDSSYAINPLHTYIIIGTYKVKLYTITDNGCVDSFLQDVSLYPLPQVNFTGSNACVNNTISFSDSTLNLDTLLTYKWDFGDSTFSTLKNPFKAFSKPGTYVVKLIVHNSNKCADSIEKNITIYPKPEIDFEVSSACQNEVVQYINKSNDSKGKIVAYHWSFGDGDTLTAINPYHIYDSAGTYNIVLSAINEYGCTDSISHTLEIYKLPSPAFSFNNTCTDSFVTFANSSTTSEGNIIKQDWNFGDGDISILENPAHLYASPGNYNVTLKVTSDKGCTDSISQTITIYPKPKPSFTTNNICLYEAAIFKNASSIDTGKIVSYNWNFGDSATSTAENPTHLYDSIGQYKVVLKVTNSFGCTDTFSQLITVYPKPRAKFFTQDICLSETAYFSDSSSMAAEYSWNFGDSSISHLQNPIHKYFSAGTYMVKLIVKNTLGCTDTFTKEIVVSDMPKAIFSVHDICFTENLELADSSKGATGRVWKFGDDSNTDEENPSHYYGSAGAYNIWLIVSNKAGCKDSVMHTITVDSSCVWPGDANGDKIVDNKDILAIGLAYSDTGSKRNDTSTEWKANFIQNWSNNFSSGQNYKHADSDGDGIISYTDTLAVTRNYTKTHAKKENTNRGKNTDPVLKIDIQNDSLRSGDTLVAYIILGENALPAKDVYGLAFHLNYNAEYFSSVNVDFTGNWLGTNTLAYSNSKNGIDIALTRIDHQDATGSGKIATIRLIIKQDQQPDFEQLKLEIIDNFLISADERVVPTNVEDDSVKVYKEPNGIIKTNNPLQDKINVYPNPFSNYTIVEYNLQQNSNVALTLYDINGRIYTLIPTVAQAGGTQQYILDANQLKISSGIYLLRIEIDGVPAYKRIVKID